MIKLSKTDDLPCILPYFTIKNSELPLLPELYPVHFPATPGRVDQVHGIGHGGTDHAVALDDQRLPGFTDWMILGGRPILGHLSRQEAFQKRRKMSWRCSNCHYVWSFSYLFYMLGECRIFGGSIILLWTYWASSIFWRCHELLEMSRHTLASMFGIIVEMSAYFIASFGDPFWATSMQWVNLLDEFGSPKE